MSGSDARSNPASVFWRIRAFYCESTPLRIAFFGSGQDCVDRLSIFPLFNCTNSELHLRHRQVTCIPRNVSWRMPVCCIQALHSGQRYPKIRRNVLVPNRISPIAISTVHSIHVINRPPLASMKRIGRKSTVLDPIQFAAEPVGPAPKQYWPTARFSVHPFARMIAWSPDIDLLLSQNQIQYPTSSDMRPRSSAMGKNFGVGATGFL
jgi:hypothetical protein